MTDFALLDRYLIVIILTTLAIGIAFGPEIRDTVARLRGSVTEWASNPDESSADERAA